MPGLQLGPGSGRRLLVAGCPGGGPDPRELGERFRGGGEDRDRLAELGRGVRGGVIVGAHQLLLSSAAPAAGGRRVVLVPGRVEGGCQVRRAELGSSLRLALSVDGVELLGCPAGSRGLLGAALRLPHPGHGVGEDRELSEQRE